MASLHCYGPTRTDAYQPLPKWRRQAKRPSCQDLVTLLRQKILDHPTKFPTAQAAPAAQTMVQSAAA